MATPALVHCPSCDRFWIENLFAEDHFIGHLRECPFPDCGRKGLFVDTMFPDSGKRSLKENWR